MDTTETDRTTSPPPVPGYEVAALRGIVRMLHGARDAHAECQRRLSNEEELFKLRNSALIGECEKWAETVAKTEWTAQNLAEKLFRETGSTNPVPGVHVLVGGSAKSYAIVAADLTDAVAALTAVQEDV